MQQMENYLNSIISLQLPAQYYLTQPIAYDQQFTNATMYTPLGPIWKNLYQVGNWQYDETTNSFWQMQHVPINIETSSTTNSSAENNPAFQNSIFTEWITRQPYEILCSITIYQISYPFYVGLIFNKSRWISGDSYGIQKYRTIGIFGKNPTSINLTIAQQKNNVSAKKPSTSKGQTTPQPLYPLQQIFNGQSQQLTQINANFTNNIQQQPLTIHIKIKPTTTSVAYKAWLASSTEPQSYSKITTSITTTKKPVFNSTKTISNSSYNPTNANDIFLYHGIGFISAGAIAQFNLQAPQSLTFASNNIQLFTTEINNYISKQQALAQTQQIDSDVLPTTGATS
jgi:hypothetical protein